MWRIRFHSEVAIGARGWPNVGDFNFPGRILPSLKTSPMATLDNLENGDCHAASYLKYFLCLIVLFNKSLAIFGLN